MAQKQKPVSKAPSKTKVNSKSTTPKRGGSFTDKNNWFLYYSPFGYFWRNPFSFWLLVFTFVVFGNGIYNDYALDDEFYTNKGNKLTEKGVSAIPEIFKTHTFYNNDGSGYSYRPISVASFAIEHSIFKGDFPHASHFINVLLYGILLILLFELLRKWFSTQGNWFSFLISLLFLVHPLHTEVVDNIKCRDELLAMFFALSSIHVLWKFRETGNKILLFIYPLLFLAAELSKTTVLPFYVLIPLALWFFTNDGWKKIALYMIPMIIVGAVTKICIHFGLPPQSRTYKDFENPLWGDVSFMKHTATSFYIIGRYFYMQFIPYPLVYYYGYKYVDIVSWSNPIAIFSLLIHGALGIIALKELKKKSILGFGLLFYLINIAIFSNLVKPAPGLMAERFAFGASLGSCIVAVVLIFNLLKKDPAFFKWNPEYYKPRNIILGIVVIFAVMSFVRNEDWENKNTLYGHDMETLTESAKANMLYGALLSKDAMQKNFEARQTDRNGQVMEDQQKKAEAMGMFLNARQYYKKATEIAPYYNTAWSNLGTTYFFTGDPKGALPYFIKAVKINGDYAEGWFNVGMAYDKLQHEPSITPEQIKLRKDSATIAFSLSIKSDSTYVPSYEQLSRIMQDDNNLDGALELMRKAARNKPDSESPWNTISSIYLQKRTSEDTARAAASEEMAAQINPENYQRLYRLAQYFKMHGDMTKADQYYAEAQQQEVDQQKKQKKMQEEQQDR